MLRLLLLFALTAALTGCSPQSAPAKLAPGATLDVYIIVGNKAPNTTEAVDPGTGGPLFLQTPPIITAADVATVLRSEIEINTVGGTPTKRTQTALDVNLTPAGAAKMVAATATPMGQPIAVVINGQVVGTPKLFSPIKESFQISGIHVRFTPAIEALTRP